MHRRYIRAIINVDSTEKDIPIGFLGPGQVLFYDGAQITSETVVIGPTTPATVVGQIAVWNNTTGSLLAASTVTASGGALANVATINTINPATWVVGPASAVNNRIAVFNGTTGKLIADGGILASSLVRSSPVSSIDGDLAVYSGTSGVIITDSNLLLSNVVFTTGGTVTSGNIPQYASTTGRQITDTGISSTTLVLSFTTPVAGRVTSWQGVGKNVIDAGFLAADVVRQVSVSVVATNLASYSTTTGRLLVDSGINTANVVLAFGGSAVAGNLPTFTGATDTVIGNSGIALADLVRGPASVTTGRLASFNGTTGKIIQQTTIGESAGALTGVVSINGTSVTGTSGFVVGPSGGSTNNALAVWSGTTGTVLRNSGLSESTAGTLNANNVVASNISSSTVNTSIPTNNIISYNAAALGPLTNELAGWDTGTFPYKLSYRAVQVTAAGAISQVTTLNGMNVSDIVRISGPPTAQSIAVWQSSSTPPTLEDSAVLIIGTDVQGINNISVATINGVDPDNHNARHTTTSGGDSILQTAVSWTTKDVLRYSGAQFDPRYILAVNTGGQAVGTSFVTHLTQLLSPNSGGSYVGRVSFPLNQGDTSGNMVISVAWSVGTTVTATVGGLSAVGVITSSGGTVSRPTSGLPAVMLVDITLAISSAVANTNIIISIQKTSGTSGSTQPGIAYFIQV